jgi:hypothetical protein
MKKEDYGRPNTNGLGSIALLARHHENQQHTGGTSANHENKRTAQKSEWMNCKTASCCLADIFL